MKHIDEFKLSENHTYDMSGYSIDFNKYPEMIKTIMGNKITKKIRRIIQR